MEHFRAFLKKLVRSLMVPAKPGPLYVFAEGESMSKIKMVSLIPPLSGEDDDVTKRTMVLTIDDNTPIVTDLPDGAIDFRFSAPRGAKIHLELADEDNAGNRSEPSVRDFVVQDTIAPHKPGDLSVSVEGQVADTDPTVYP